jgi:hypothetical protein
MQLDDFTEVWLVNFECDRDAGERPKPSRLTAQEYRSLRRLCLEWSDLYKSAPPFEQGSRTLVVAYDAPAALGCQLTLGWPMPAHVLDLHAEFRGLTAGLTVPGDYDLKAALAHLGLARAHPKVAPMHELRVTLFQRPPADATARASSSRAGSSRMSISVAMDVRPSLPHSI